VNEGAVAELSEATCRYGDGLPYSTPQRSEETRGNAITHPIGGV